MQYEVAFIGAGNMAEAIARGLLGGEVVGAGRMIAADVSAARREVFAGLGIRCVESAPAAAAEARAIVLAVKPQHMADVLSGLRGKVSAEQMLLSIAAGISTAYIEGAVGGQPAVVRSMPNTPMLVGAGAVAICAGRYASAAHLDVARRYFESSAVVLTVEERQMDAVTAVSGSGPAYFFYLVEHLVAAGVAEGLSEEQARTLAFATARGAAMMLNVDGADPADLRRRVTSPGGTTQAAITHLDSREWGIILRQAVTAAARRSCELGR